MKIYYLCPDSNSAVGGIKVIYQHVIILRELGFEANVLHGKAGFKCTWFEHNAPIKYFDTTKIEPNDYVVIPEIFFHLRVNPDISLKNKIRKFIGKKEDYYAARKIWITKCKKVIFNQNAFHTFLDLELDFDFKKLGELIVLDAILCISEQNKKYLEYCFKNTQINRVKWSLDFSKFNFDPSKKKKIISYMPRKNSLHSKQVISILKARSFIDNFEIQAIDGLNETQVAEKLAESWIFLSFGYPEGLPLPPAEAMASGCIVVGYDGGGGEEYFKPEFSYKIAFGEIINFCEKVEEICKHFDSNFQQILEKAHSASDFIKQNYSSEIETKYLSNAWQKILQK
jgi:glycosyltransferase involved in cell wall biosynthesis